MSDEIRSQPEQSDGPVKCGSCGEFEDEPATEQCPASKFECGHHCNHSWTHDSCCWCGGAWGEGGAFTPGSRS